MTGASDMEELLKVDVDAWRAEFASIRENYASYGDRLPKELDDALEKLEANLS